MGNSSQRDLLTTGQAAEVLSVTPDAVLKWIKAGKLPAQRTPGGHYRLKRKDIMSLVAPHRRNGMVNNNERSFKYCWEYNAQEGEILEGCLNCVVYRSKSMRCYEMVRLPDSAGHSKIYCKTSCTDCDYYELVRWQRSNILLVTDDATLRSRLEDMPEPADYNLRTVDCGYTCSMIIENYRPDFVIIDCRIGRLKTLDFVRNIEEDPRIPLARIILVGKERSIEAECDRAIFARMKRPFTIPKLENLVRNLQLESSMDELQIGR